MFKKLSMSLLIACLILPVSTAFAGGSSALWGVKSSQFSTKSGATIKNAFALNMHTYFSVNGMEDMRMTNLAISCTGSDIISKFHMQQGTTKIGEGEFVKNGNLFTASLDNKDFVLKNDSTYNFKIDLDIKNNAANVAVTHCAISNITLFDIKNNNIIFSNADTDGYVFVEQNQAAMITIGSKSKQKLLSAPFQKLYAKSPYGIQYIGDGYVWGKIIRKGSVNRYEDSTKYILEVSKFDNSFANAGDVFNFAKMPVKFYLNVQDADTKRGSLMKIHVRDFYLMNVDVITPDNGGYPFGYMTYVKN